MCTFMLVNTVTNILSIIDKNNQITANFHGNRQFKTKFPDFGPKIKFPDFSLTIIFSLFSRPCGNPAVCFSGFDLGVFQGEKTPDFWPKIKTLTFP